jgi:hypothetical protein
MISVKRGKVKLENGKGLITFFVVNKLKNIGGQRNSDEDTKLDKKFNIEKRHYGANFFEPLYTFWNENKAIKLLPHKERLR